MPTRPGGLPRDGHSGRPGLRDRRPRHRDAKLLLNSREQLAAGVANNSGQVGQNLMDHPLYLTWGLTPKPTFPYRGPLATAGIESLRDGPFRARPRRVPRRVRQRGLEFHQRRPRDDDARLRRRPKSAP